MPSAHDKNTTETATLEGLRGRIDAIDREIADLLLKRLGLVARVGELKRRGKVEGSYIRMRREAVMLRDLIKRFEGTGFPPAAAASIWRTIIGASTLTESPLSLSVLCEEADRSPYFLAREYFGGFVPCAMRRDAAQVLRDITRNPHTVGVFPSFLRRAFHAPADRPRGNFPSCWWEALARSTDLHKPTVFAVLPFFRGLRDATPQPAALAVGRVDLLPTGEDETLCVLTAEKPLRPEDWAAFAPADHAGLEIAPAGNAALCSVPGFHYDDPAALAALLKAINAVSGSIRVEGTCIGAVASAYVAGTS